MIALLMAISITLTADTVRERAVTIPGPVPLAGVLTLPAEGTARSPGVVIVHGSGGGDRNGTLGPNTPYRDLARALAARGITVLRYDKRAGVRPLWYANRTFTVREETIDDAVSALQLLRSQPEVDSTRVFVLGHSLGGFLAPRIAAADGRLAGMVLMAGAFITPLPELMIRQMDYIASVSPPEDSSRVAAQRRVFQHNATRIAAMTEADSASKVLYLGAPAAYWLDLRRYDPAAALRTRTEPTLILQGERDYQVTTQMLDEFLNALGPRPQTTVRRYPDLNHLLIPGAGPPRPAEYNDPGHVADEVSRDIAEWIGTVGPGARTGTPGTSGVS
jgi:alpha-beta hydrolase superfamily lysophospholipase